MNLLKADLFHYFKDRTTYVLLGIVFVMLLFTCLMYGMSGGNMTVETVIFQGLGTDLLCAVLGLQFSFFFGKRRQKGYKIDVLAREMGIDSSTLSRYENGKIDIPASAMAYASYVCDFELSEYTIRRQDEKKLSQLFKEIVRYGEEERPKTIYQRLKKNPI